MFIPPPELLPKIAGIAVIIFIVWFFAHRKSFSQGWLLLVAAYCTTNNPRGDYFTSSMEALMLLLAVLWTTNVGNLRTLWASLFWIGWILALPHMWPFMN